MTDPSAPREHGVPRRRRRRRDRRTGWPGRLLRLGLLAIFCAAFFWWSQNDIVTETIPVAGAPAGFDGYRIVLITDLHGKQFGDGNETLLKKTAALRPDLIALVGDIVDENSDLSILAPLADGLSAIAPTYYVTGNHEWAAGKVNTVRRILSEHGVQPLVNEIVELERNGDTISLLGAEDSFGPSDQKTVAELAAEARAEDPDRYLLLLCHRQNRYLEYEQARIDLTLAGHAHGGAIRLPFTDGLIGPQRELFPKYTAGLYTLSYGQMVVSRGLGTPPYRLFNRPDLPLIILQSSET